MRLGSIWRLTGFLAATLAYVACSNDGRPPYLESACFEGDRRSCDCASGQDGYRLCEEGDWGACDCDGSVGYGEGGAGAVGGQPGGAGNDPVDLEVLRLSALVDYHYDASGVRFVTEEGVIHYGWQGEEIARYEAERPLTTSGYADGLLVIADSGAIIGLDEDLDVLYETQVVESCVAGGMVTGHRFVCGPNEDWDRIIYVYDGETGELLASSDGDTYAGLPIRVVPGSDKFITVSGGSPRDYHLFTVGSDDVPSYVADSIYHGDIIVGYEYGFAGEPIPTHVIAPEGVMLNFASADCNPDDRQCFLKDGNLGTLPGTAAVYVSVSTEQDGEVFGLISPGGYSYSGPCEGNCILQRIEVETRSVLATKIVPDLLFAADTRPQAFYLIPTPDGNAVWLVQSGRSIYHSGYDDSLNALVQIVPMPMD